jgi:hypothetical protein
MRWPLSYYLKFCFRFSSNVVLPVVVVVFVALLLMFSEVAEAHFRVVPRSRPGNLAAENIEAVYSADVVPHEYYNNVPVLEFDFYKKTCPQLPLIVEKVVAAEFAFDPTSAGPQLRLFFHDCFVQGCDASVLINSTDVDQAEKDAAINFSLGNFFVIDDIKEQLEKECPGVVSCADVLALVAVYSVKQVLDSSHTLTST